MIYVLYGTEKKLIDKKIIEFKKEHNDIDTNSVVKYDMREINISIAINDMLTPSMFSNKKLVICDNCYFLTGSKVKIEIDHSIDVLVEYVEKNKMDDILILVVNGEKLDVRKKIVKLLNKSVTVINIGDGKKNIEGYIISTFKNRGFQIDNRTAGYLNGRVGSNISLLDNEFDKLCLYKSEEREIRMEDIDALVSKSFEDNIFDLIDSMIKNDKKRMFDVYNDLILKKEEPIKIIVMIANQFRLFYQTKLLIKKGYTEKDIASLYGIHPYRVKLASMNGRKYSEELLKSYLMKLSDLDIKIKTGKIDKNIGLELFFIKM